MQEAQHNGRTERRDAAENRKRILEAASRLFGLYGIGPVSMNQIAAEAAIGAGTLYRRFRNKSELCIELLKDSKTLLSQEIDAYLLANGAQKPEVRLRGVLEILIRFKENHAELLTVIESGGVAPEADYRLQSPLYTEMHSVLADLFKEMGVHKAHFRQDYMFRTDMLITAISSDSYLYQRNVRGSSPERIVNQLCQLFLA